MVLSTSAKSVFDPKSKILVFCIDYWYWLVFYIPLGKKDLTLPCSKLCEPPVEEGVEEVDVDDDIDQGQSVADKVGKGVPGKSFGILPFFAILLGLAFDNKKIGTHCLRTAPDRMCPFAFAFACCKMFSWSFLS